jgi:hypothetical protein
MPSHISKKYNRLFVGNVIPGPDQNSLREEFEDIGRL